MDPSVRYLMGVEESAREGATIHTIDVEAPTPTDQEKIGFTLDVVVRLDQEARDDDPGAEIVPISGGEPQRLADSA